MKATTGETTNDRDIRDQWLPLSENEKVRFRGMLIAATEWLVQTLEETEQRISRQKRNSRAA